MNIKMNKLSESIYLTCIYQTYKNKTQNFINNYKIDHKYLILIYKFNNEFRKPFWLIRWSK